MELLLHKPRLEFQRSPSTRHRIVTSPRDHLFFRQKAPGPWEGGPRTL